MRIRLAACAIAASVALTACGATTTSATEVDAGSSGGGSAATPRTYTSQQTAVFRNYFKQAMSDLGSSGAMVTNFTFNWNDATEERWAQVEGLAQGMCNTAASEGWPKAITEFRADTIDQLSQQMKDEAGQDLSDVDPALINEILDPVINVYVSSVTEAGSYCPDVPDAPASEVPQSEAGVSGLAPKSAEEDYVAAFRSDSILGPLTADSTDQQLIAMSVPVCVGKQDEDMTRRENIDSYIDIGIDPVMAERIVDLSLTFICP